MLVIWNDLNPNTADSDGLTPLLRAVCGRKEGLVRILLERNDLNPNIADEHGQTPSLGLLHAGTWRL